MKSAFSRSVGVGSFLVLVSICMSACGQDAVEATPPTPMVNRQSTLPSSAPHSNAPQSSAPQSVPPGGNAIDPMAMSVEGPDATVANQTFQDLPGSVEIELLHLSTLNRISSHGTVYNPGVAQAGLLPRGSALITRSGNLRRSGILAVIHAASGSSGRMDPLLVPSLQGVDLSVRNSLILAQRFGHRRVAVPYIGGAIFLGRIGVPPQQLVETIIRAALESRGNLEIRFVLIGNGDAQLFRRVLQNLRNEVQFQGLEDSVVQVLLTSITDFSVHQCTAIVNAANVEVTFGGGISGAIGAATGDPAGINQDARQLMADFNRHIP